jgi:broad specificity phosphatase PhoE
MPILVDTDLREIYAGEWEGMLFDDLKKRYPDSYAQFRRDIGHSCPDGGESTVHLGERMYACVERIARACDGERVLLATHATAIGMFTCVALGLSPDQYRNLALPSNASLTVFTYLDGRFVLRRYGEDAYLGELRTPAPTLVV